MVVRVVKSMKKSYLYIILFIVLFAGFTAALVLFTDWYNQSKLPKRSTVQPFQFINQDSATFTNSDMLGKVCVVAYFFTTCKTVCPVMNSYMKTVYETFKDNPDFLIVSHSCEPEVDSVPLLKAYSKQMGADGRHWVFVTGDKLALYKMARFSYGIDDPQNAVDDIKDDFLHSQFFALVDKNGNVRGGVYDGLKPEEVDKMKADIKDLLKEKSRTHFTGVFSN